MEKDPYEEWEASKRRARGLPDTTNDFTKKTSLLTEASTPKGRAALWAELGDREQHITDIGCRDTNPNAQPS